MERAAAARNPAAGPDPKGADSVRPPETNPGPLFLLHEGDAPGAPIAALASALGGTCLGVADAGALPAGAGVLLPEALLEDFASPPDGGSLAVLATLGADTLLALPGGALARLRERLAAAEVLFVSDPRAAAAWRLAAGVPVRWLGFPLPARLREAPPADCASEAASGVLVLPARREADAPECLRAAELLLRDIEGADAVRPLPGKGLVPDPAAPPACALCLDPRARFGYEALELAALGVPCVGSVRMAAQALLFPKLTVDPLLELDRARDLLAGLLAAPAQRILHGERARARLAGLFGPDAVRERFEDAFRAGPPKRDANRSPRLRPARRAHSSEGAQTCEP
jgi:hypothetical protein